MKLSRGQLRKMILSEIKNLSEMTGRYVSGPVGSVGSFYSDSEGYGWGKESNWNQVERESIWEHFITHNEASGISPKEYLAQVKQHGKPFQLKKVGEALSSLTSDDPAEQAGIDDLYSDAFEQHGSRLYPGKYRESGMNLPQLPKSYANLDDDEFDFDDDDDDDVYPGPLIP